MHVQTIGYYKRQMSDKLSLFGDNSNIRNIWELCVRLLLTTTPGSLHEREEVNTFPSKRQVLCTGLAPVCVMKHLVIDICNCQSFAQVASLFRAPTIEISLTIAVTVQTACRHFASRRIVMRASLQRLD